MKKLKHGKVILLAAGIILVCIAALVVSIHVAFGAVTDKVAADFAAETEIGITVAEENTGEPTPVSDLETGSSSASVSENKTVSGGTSPGAQFITQGDAISAFINIATNVCGLDPDPDDLTATFNASYDGIDENGNVVYTIRDNWEVSGAGCTACVDAISGDVVHFEDNNEYSKRGTTLGRFHMMSYDSFSDPDTIYLKTAMDIVKAGLAEGRSIDHAEIDGIQFAWDNNTQGQDPDATGTILVDCHIYMESGLSYTISLWGDMSALHVHWFSSHPTWDACRWGYYYEEDAQTFSGEPQTAPGITEDAYLEEDGRN